MNIKKAFVLFISFIAVNITYIISGLLYQKLAKNSYYNIQTSRYDLFRSSIGFGLVMSLSTWLLTQAKAKATLKKTDYVVINKKYSIVCGLIIVISSISFMEALYLISYPYIMMAKSSSVLQIALLGVFCNQMKDQKEKFGRGKIINAFIVTLGVILFKLFDPETSFQSQISRQTQLLGFLLLLINLCSDYFLPDFQAEIKSNFEPKSAQMHVQIARWSFLICLIGSILTGDLVYTYNFMCKHPIFTYEIIALAILFFVGQTFAYKIIQNFSKNMIPLIESSKKTFTVSTNLVFFGHRKSSLQIFGIVIAFSITIWQFLEDFIRNLVKLSAKQDQKNIPNIQIQFTFQPLSNTEQQSQKNLQKVNAQFKNENFQGQEQSSQLRPT